MLKSVVARGATIIICIIQWCNLHHPVIHSCHGEQEEAFMEANRKLDKRQVHNPLKGANFGAEGLISQYLGDDAANSSGKAYQEATSEACRKRSNAHFDSPAGSATREKMATTVPIYLPHRSLDTR